MLNKEHLLCRIVSGRVKPCFVDPDSPEMLLLAERFISLYSQAAATAMRRGELAAAAGAMIRNENEIKIASGLNKLLLDRSEFAAVESKDYPAERRKIFLASAAALRSGTLPEVPAWDIYGDLPDFEVVCAWKELTPQSLLHRYNLALAQGVLFYAEKLSFTVRSPDRAEMRKLLKAVKFFRLLAHFSNGGKGEIRAEISGPYSLFGPTVKYALNLANLLPALVNLPHWEMRAKVNFKGRELELKLNHKSGLVSHYRNLAGYIPEEIRVFHRQFAARSCRWQITGDTPFLDGGEQEIIFPDFSFTDRESGKLIHAELFHRWHAGMLEKRIALLKKNPSLPLVLGIERSLISDPAILAGKFADAPALLDRCWLFRDFPGVESTLRVLQKAVESV